jgi:hypothetical protein
MGAFPAQAFEMRRLLVVEKRLLVLILLVQQNSFDRRASD